MNDVKAAGLPGFSFSTDDFIDLGCFFSVMRSGHCSVIASLRRFAEGNVFMIYELKNAGRLICFASQICPRADVVGLPGLLVAPGDIP
jgi:hypothetical protein